MASTLPFGRIFLMAHSQYRMLFVRFAEAVKARYGAEVHLYCVTPQEAVWYRGHAPDHLFALVTVANRLYQVMDGEAGDSAAIIETARRNEDFLGTTYNELAVADRHLGRGYALGGFYHPRSRVSEQTSYVRMLSRYNEDIGFWRREYEEKRPTLTIQGNKVSSVVSRAHGVPVRILAASRTQNLYYWAHNEFFESPAFEAAYHRLGPVAVDSIEKPYSGHMANRGFLTRQGQLGYVVKTIVMHVLRRLYGRIRGYEKARNYFLSDEIRLIWRQRLGLRALQRQGRRLNEKEHDPFVFFPLHTEPEAALQLLSPEYFFQLSAIAATSRDLPAGVSLAVKEALFAVGRRPDNFYDQISAFKNVFWFDPMELGLEIVRRTRALITITGTSGFEAAVLGKPVITFGRHNLYNFLPHVKVVEDETRLKGYLQWALSEAFDEAAARQAGSRFLAAVKDVSFDLRDYDFRKPNKVEDGAIENMLKNIIFSFPEE